MGNFSIWYNVICMDLDTHIIGLNRVGAVLAKRLKQLGIQTVKDLLFYFPFRYEDYRAVTPISAVSEGDGITVKGTIEIIASRRSPRKRKMLTEAVVNDGTDQLRVIWFGQPYISKTLKVGDEVYLSGKVKTDMLGTQMISPAYEKARAETDTTHTARIVPMYHLTNGITQKQMRFLVTQALTILKRSVTVSHNLDGGLEDWIPDDLRKRAKLIQLAEAIEHIHFPKNEKEKQIAERRLKFDELFVLQLRSEMIRQSIKDTRARVIPFKEKEIKEFVARLPFELTKDQKIAAWEILQDIEKTSPMNRLLEGDVGSGKTVVAALVMYNVVLNNLQATIMAPTEILARQHFASLKGMYGETIRVALVTGSEIDVANIEMKEKSKKGKREELWDLVKQGKIDILVGTHALLSEHITFKKLGLVIVDEQHRFGVAQRKEIKEQSNERTIPHFLSMTATPIPRSFALTLYGDLDISVIKHMPVGRKEIKTRLVDPHNREKAYQFIRAQIKEGRQAFVICPLIEESKDAAVEKKSVLAEYKKLSEQIFPDLNVTYLHGKMKSADKEIVMEDFAKGRIDILVSTSVVEVGVNIPNASVMMIEGAERFGLAQLHQFRGRVGRSVYQSYCFVFTDSDSEKANERLKYFEQNSDGFALAEYDLQTRGPGEVYGTAQSGMMNFRLATMRDIDLIKLSRELARDIDFEKYPTLRQKVDEWERIAHLE